MVQIKEDWNETKIREAQSMINGINSSLKTHIFNREELQKSVKSVNLFKRIATCNRNKQCQNYNRINVRP